MPLLNYDIGARFRKAWGASVDWNNFSTANEEDRKKREAHQTDMADAYVLVCFSSSVSLSPPPSLSVHSKPPNN